MCKLSVALLAECVFMATKHGRELVARELKKTSRSKLQLLSECHSIYLTPTVCEL